MSVPPNMMPPNNPAPPPSIPNGPMPPQGMTPQGIQPPMPPQQPMMPPPPPTLHDVVVKRVLSRGRVRIEPVPPEEFLISRRAKSIDDTPFCCHRMQMTISDLKSAGYKNVDDIASDDYSTMSSERIERMLWDDDYAAMGSTDDHTGNGDPSSRFVWVDEVYLKVDMDGDGIQEWRKCVRVGETLLGDPETGEFAVECDGPPFAELKPVIMPHRWTGLSLAEMAMPSQRERTALKRAILDDLYLRVNGRTWAVDGQVNLDDLLTNRPGGVVRIKQPGMVGPLQQGLGDSAAAYQMLEYSLEERENRTGFTRYSQGQNADSLNNTATGINIITNRSDERIELIARTFAETGVKQLFLRMLKLVCQHQDQPEDVPLAKGWKTIDPRGWKNQFDFSVNVGLGTGNKDQIVQHLMAFQNFAQFAGPFGVIKPENIHEMGKKLIEALGFGKSVDQMLTDPAQVAQMPPPPDPRIQLEQAKLQSDAQIAQLKAQTDLKKTEMELAVEREKILMDARIKAATNGVTLPEDDEDAEDRQQTIEDLLMHIAHLTAGQSSKRVIRDQAGKVIGVDSGSAPAEQIGALQQSIAHKRQIRQMKKMAKIMQPIDVPANGELQ